MVHLGLRRRRSTVALVAAAILCVQAFFSAWATGAMASAPMLDAFGNPICTTVSDPDASPASDHSKHSDCCAFGCSAASPSLSAPDFESAGINRPLVRAAVLLAIGSPVVVSMPEHDPASPRAPPTTA